jgi:predicted nicotinamide N-methyase
MAGDSLAHRRLLHKKKRYDRPVASFVREHTTLAPVPFVPEVSVFTATEVTPLWQATGEWLGRAGVDVPFWSVPWAGGQALARFLLDHPGTTQGKRVVDFGAGSGLVAIAAAMAGAARVTAADVDPLAIEACALNAEANGVTILTERADPIGADLECDLLVAGDVWYDRALAERLVPWLDRLALRGIAILTGDPGRSYVPAALREVARYEIPTTLDLESRTSRTTRVLAR